VNIASLDVLNHKRLLDSARADPSAISFQVRPVDVVTTEPAKKSSFGSLERFGSLGRASLSASGVALSSSFGGVGALGAGAAAAPSPARRPLARPAFGSSPNLQALVLEAEERADAAAAAAGAGAAAFYEVTIASVDQPRLLARLSESLGDLGLNICEAHAFNSRDRFALDVFVVSGWAGGGVDELEEVLSARLQELPPPGTPSRRASLSAHGPGGAGGAGRPGPPSPRTSARLLELPGELAALQAAAAAAGEPDDWELDPREVVFHEKIAAGAFGDLFRGVYCGQDVAIKVLRGVQNDSAQFREFLQEVAIMRKVRRGLWFLGGLGSLWLWLSGLLWGCCADAVLALGSCVARFCTAFITIARPEPSPDPPTQLAHLPSAGPPPQRRPVHRRLHRAPQPLHRLRVHARGERLRLRAPARRAPRRGRAPHRGRGLPRDGLPPPAEDRPPRPQGAIG
jgi:hypothetical protein